MKKKSILLLLVVALTFGVAMVGCTPKESTPGNGSNGGGTYVGSDRGNVLTIGGSSPDGVFNPLTSSSVYDRYINDLVFDKMLEEMADGSVSTEGGIVEKYDISEDGLTYTFHFRDGIKWHDGEPVTAKDAVFTFNTIFATDYKGRLYGAVMQDIVGAAEVKAGNAETAEGVKALDDLTLEIKVKSPKATTLRQLGVLHIIPEHYYGGKNATELAALDRDPLGNGKFKIKKYAVEQYVDLEPNAEYWQGAPKLDGIIYKVIANVDELSEFQTGNIDTVNFEGSIENYETAKTFEHGDLINNLNNGYAYVAFNFKKPILQDKNVRQALVYGLDRQGFVTSFFGTDGGFVSHTPISQVSWAYPDESKLNMYEYNPEKAGELLDASGWTLGSDGYRHKDGEKLTVKWVSYQESAWATKLTALAVDQWKKIGVDCKIELMDFNSLSELVSDPGNAEKWDLYNMAWTLTGDPDMYETYSKTQFAPGSNRGFFSNDHIEDLMVKGLEEFDQAKREEIYQELAIEFNEELPYIYVYTRNNPWLVNKRVKNFDPTEFQYWTHNAHEIEVQ